MERDENEEDDPVVNDQETSITEEKKRELQLLEEVLGKKIKSNSDVSKREQ